MPERTIYDSVEFNDNDFYCSYLTRKIPWKSIIRVAFEREIFPQEFWFEDFWAFQTNDSQFLLSVKTESISGMQFSDEIRRRYDVPSKLNLENWTDTKFLIKTFVVYPKTDYGKPLYKWTKKHWYSLNYKMEFYQS